MWPLRKPHVHLLWITCVSQLGIHMCSIWETCVSPVIQSHVFYVWIPLGSHRCISCESHVFFSLWFTCAVSEEHMCFCSTSITCVPHVPLLWTHVLTCAYLFSRMCFTCVSTVFCSPHVFYCIDITCVSHVNHMCIMSEKRLCFSSYLSHVFHMCYHPCQ
jgi:hypothetical protein